MPSNSQWTLLARILRPQGRKGEVLADLFTDFPDRFASHPDVWLGARGFTDVEPGRHSERASPEPAHVVAYWLPLGRNAGRVVLQFAGVDSISAAERLSGKEVVVPAESRLSLEPGAVYISDLVGCTVYDLDAVVGTVEHVEFSTSADGSRRLDEAAPLLVVSAANGSEILIPFAKEYLVTVDTGGKILRMRLPQGLTEVNAPDAD